MNNITVKSVLNRAKQTDSWFLDDYTINGYSGCTFNCLYCYIRGSKYGTNMAEKASVKSNALEVLEKQLYNRAKKNQQGFIVMSSATDPYLHFENEQKLTRGMLELMLKYKFPVHIITKSALILRDTDLLHEIDEQATIPAHLNNKIKNGVIISFSFSTIDDQIGRVFESGATPPTVRLQTAKTLIDQGFLTGVSMMPTLPYISDTTHSLNSMFGAFQKIGMKYILPSTITLFGHEPHDSRTLMFRAVKKYYPDLYPKYERLLGKADFLPKYYNDAYLKKMNELSIEYKIPLRILK